MPAIENESMKVGDLPNYVRKSFSGSVRHMKLRSGIKLFTLSRKPILIRGAEKTVTEWWSPFDEFRDDPGYDGRVTIAQSIGAKTFDVMKDMAAYENQKAGGRWVVIGKLRRPIFGFYGRIRRQNLVALKTRSNSSNVNGLNAVGYQFYIPNLHANVNISRVGKIDLR